MPRQTQPKSKPSDKPLAPKARAKSAAPTRKEPAVQRPAAQPRPRASKAKPRPPPRPTPPPTPTPTPTPRVRVVQPRVSNAAHDPAVIRNALKHTLRARNFFKQVAKDKDALASTLGAVDGIPSPTDIARLESHRKQTNKIIRDARATVTQGVPGNNDVQAGGKSALAQLFPEKVRGVKGAEPEIIATESFHVKTTWMMEPNPDASGVASHNLVVYPSLVNHYLESKTSDADGKTTAWETQQPCAQYAALLAKYDLVKCTDLVVKIYVMPESGDLPSGAHLIYQTQADADAVALTFDQSLSRPDAIACDAYEQPALRLPCIFTYPGDTAWKEPDAAIENNSSYIKYQRISKTRQPILIVADMNWEGIISAYTTLDNPSATTVNTNATQIASQALQDVGAAAPLSVSDPSLLDQAFSVATNVVGEVVQGLDTVENVVSGIAGELGVGSIFDTVSGFFGLLGLTSSDDANHAIMSLLRIKRYFDKRTMSFLASEAKEGQVPLELFQLVQAIANCPVSMRTNRKSRATQLFIGDKPFSFDPRPLDIVHPTTAAALHRRAKMQRVNHLPRNDGLVVV